MDKLIEEPELHYACDRRIYNGAICSDLQKEIDSRTNLFRTIQKEYPEYQCTYFPAESKFMSFIKYGQLTGNMFEDEGQCLLEAWEFLIKRESE